MEKTNKNGITLISLIITIIVLLILAGVSINMVLGQNGLLNNSKEATEKSNKAAAIEKMHIKITSAYIEEEEINNRKLSLQVLADKLCEDDEIEYVDVVSKKIAANKITVGNATKIFTKLKAYKYEFSIGEDANIEIIDTGTIKDNNKLVYEYGEIIEIGEEEFFVLSDNGDTVTLFHFGNLNDELATWSDAKTIASNYGNALQGEGRLLTEEEFSVGYNNENTQTYFLSYYWLDTEYDANRARAVKSQGGATIAYPAPKTSTFYVRPVVTIPKNKLP